MDILEQTTDKTALLIKQPLELNFSAIHDVLQILRNDIVLHHLSVMEILYSMRYSSPMPFLFLPRWH